jgi:phosphoribosylanthranilate isomerase
MMIKVCGITRREDAESAAAAGATALGFVFYPHSPRYVTPAKAATLGMGLDVWRIGVFVKETTASIEAVMRAARLDVAQIYGGSAPAGTRVWKAFRVTGESTLELPDDAEAVLLDGPANGVPFDWKACRSDLLVRAGRPRPAEAGLKVIVAGGLDASNVAEAIRAAKPWGVDASSRLEISPGVKDHQKVQQFVEAALKA